jgi:hypothetical protein
MLTNLEVLAVTGAGLTGPLPTEYANFLGTKAVAAAASATAAAAAARADEYNSAESLSSAYGVGIASVVEESSGGRAQRVGPVGTYSKAQQQAVTDRRVAEAVQNAAGSVSPAGKPVAVIGMLKLRQLLLSGNKLTGSLPVVYAQMQELQVRGDTK